MSHKVENKILDLIQQADWDDIYPRLMKYALSKLSIRSGSPLEGVPTKTLAQDIVNEAIRKVIEGDRKWDPERGSLFNYLKYSVIQSEISHLYESDYYYLTSRMPDTQGGRESVSVNTNEVSSRSQAPSEHAPSINPGIPQSPEEALVENEVHNQLLKAVEGDEELEGIVLCILEGHEKPKIIAELLGVNPTTIYNARKRLKKIYGDILLLRR